ncbi:MAG: flagellar motor switch protein FliG [Candidatus Polarisedimenticolia bacterium]
MAGFEGMAGVQKAAILMTLIGEEGAAAVLNELEGDEVKAITAEIAKIKMIDPSQHASVLVEFQDMIQDARALELAGAPLARRLLSRVRPGEDAEKIMKQLEPRRNREEDGADLPLPELPESLVSAPARRLSMLLQDEPAQTVALVLAHLPPRRAAQVMNAMDPERRIEVTRRMASIKEVRPEVVTRVGAVLEGRLAAICDEPLIPMNGVQTAADTLQSLGRAAGGEIVDALAESCPELSQQLRDMLFTFDMLLALKDRDAQEVLKMVDRGTLALALKGADPELQELFFRNMSERAASMLKEEMEFLGAPRLADVEAAQRSIIDMVLRLEKEGAITLEEPQGAAR